MKYLPTLVIALILVALGCFAPGYLFPVAWLIASILFH